MEYFIEQLINGIQRGSIYALIALGYTMVYGVVKLINFAHGDFIMVGAYTMLFSIPLLSFLNFPLWLSIIIAMVICAILGVITEKIAYKPLRNSKRITSLITAIAVSLFLQNIAMLIFGARMRQPVNVFAFENPNLKIGDISINKVSIIIIVLSIITMVILQLIVKHTNIGRAMRAVSENNDAAKLMGININRTISITFIIGAGLAGLASIMYCSYIGSMTPMMGSAIGIKAFIAAVLGGIGIIPGAMVGGLSIGIVESMTQAYWASEITDIVVFGILILVLLLKPSGLFGRRTSGEKV